MYDVVMVGAGPAGCMAAKKTAEAGYKVLLVEKMQVNIFF
jgi:digeranylgeranylglycerophospholipid reductase